MATGDQNDMQGRLAAVLPGGWFPTQGDGATSPTPVLSAVLAGIASGLAWFFSLLTYANLQTRIATATDVFLDIIALDFLGTSLTRSNGQSDTSFRQAILQAILAPKATRPAMVAMLETLTGRTPVIFEPTNPSDCGGYAVGGCGYAVAGGYGNLMLPFQCFVTAYRPTGGGIASVAGYGNRTSFLYGAGGYGVGAIEYASVGMIQGAVTDADINAAIVANAPIATIPWTRISN